MLILISKIQTTANYAHIAKRSLPVSATTVAERITDISRYNGYQSHMLSTTHTSLLNSRPTAGVNQIDPKTPFIYSIWLQDHYLGIGTRS